MKEDKLDMLESKEEQLKILIPYLESLAEDPNKEGLPITSRTFLLISRVLLGWKGLSTDMKRGIPKLTPEGSFRYYLKLKGED